MKLQKRTVFFIGALIGVLCLAGCNKQEKEKGGASITFIEQLNNPAYTIGVPEGGAGMDMAKKYLPEAEHKTFSGNSSGYLAISQGKLDGFVYDRVMMEFAIASGLEDVELLPENLGESVDVAVGISPKSQIDHLKDKVNQFLAKERAEGTLDEMYERWVSRAEKTMPSIPVPQAPTCKLKVGTTGMVQPFSYYFHFQRFDKIPCRVFYRIYNRVPRRFASFNDIRLDSADQPGDHALCATAADTDITHLFLPPLNRMRCPLSQCSLSYWQLLPRCPETPAPLTS